ASLSWMHRTGFYHAGYFRQVIYRLQQDSPPDGNKNIYPPSTIWYFSTVGSALTLPFSCATAGPVSNKHGSSGPGHHECRLNILFYPVREKPDRATRRGGRKK